MPAAADSLIAQLTPGVHRMLDYCWATVADGGPTVIQHWVSDMQLLLTGYLPSERCVTCSGGTPAVQQVEEEGNRLSLLTRHTAALERATM